MKKLIFLLCMTGCSTVQLKEANTVYEDLHNVRQAVESIPMLTTVADSYYPWLAGVRIGLNETYALKHALIPDLSLSVTSTTETK